MLRRIEIGESMAKEVRALMIDFYPILKLQMETISIHIKC
jgi:hypothetical protein